MSDIFGQSNYGGNFTKKNYFKLKDGESVFRILPALGDNAKDGRWSAYWNVHYGYKNTKGKLRTFESSLVKNHKTKMIEAPDAALERIETLKAKFEEAKKNGNKEMVAQLDKYVGAKGMYNLDKNHYMNVIDQSGKIGILKIRHRAKVALDAEIKKLRDKGIDPLSPDNGRFFKFTRSGSGLDTLFKVDVLQETVEVPGFGPMNRDLVHKLDAEIANRCCVRQSDGSFRYVEAANLSTLYKRLTSDQIARIVKESDIKTGISPAVDEIFDDKGGSDDSGSDEGEDSPSDYDPSSSSSAPVAAAPQAAAPAQAAPVQAPAAAAPAPAQTLAEAPKAAAPTPAPASTVAEQSDADFLKSLGL